ncbi:RagB/SusD family nutrient uptake outer membrane protein [Flavihumibacter sp. UBA7668]|uniref:RagB/SusD family nutrient uptake outer membrane protein n=1 Tax=Flavihumibacter sp. UBA7668 TaxID=1946542 RepID=UPI0025BFEAD0|nr:RagB/SusD family nutrient uptake outer membrane protein [Flavihumibacter sp. UBA7668]
MRYKHIIASMVLGTMVLSGCKKDFLETRPTREITTADLAEQAAIDPSLLDGSISGLYTLMYSIFNALDDRHDDFGQKGIDIYTDMLSGDMVLGALNYGWYSPIARLQATTDFTRAETRIPWGYYYRVIRGANLVIDALGGNDAIPEVEANKFSMGQAKAIRAYAYFYLSQLYSLEYGTGSEKTVPLYTAPGQVNLPKATSTEVYNLIISDLEAAVELLASFNRGAKNQIDQNVAKGLLVYALGARGAAADWTRIETLTQELMAAYPMTTELETVAVLNGNTLTNPQSGFNNVATPSWIWGVDIITDYGLDLVSWWGQMDYYTYSYAWAGDPKIIDAGLYNSIPDNDIRKNQFDVDLWPTNKFFHPNRRIGGQRLIDADYVYMRADEFYLLNAEAKAQNGKDGEARQVLKNYLAERMPDTDYLDALSGDALKDEIYKQTRIEFWGEGKSYLALKRSKKAVTRGSNHIFEAGNTFPYNDPKLTFPIPQQEVINNPNLNN